MKMYDDLFNTFLKWFLWPPSLPEFESVFMSVLQVEPKTLSVLELQSVRGRAGQQYRVLCSVLREAEV